MKNIFEKIIEIQKGGKEAVLCTIVNTKGSTPRKVGAKMIVFENGKIFGTIGGGDLEKNVIKNLRHLGTICAFEINTNESDNYLHNIGSSFSDYCLQNGVYLRALGNTVYIMPPYCVTKKELKKVYSTVVAFLQSIITKD